jgi:hypothetical protein
MGPLPSNALDWEVFAFEVRARWCDEHGYPSDAAQHRAYVAQLRRGALVSREGGGVGAAPPESCRQHGGRTG